MICKKNCRCYNIILTYNVWYVNILLYINIEKGLSRRVRLATLIIKTKTARGSLCFWWKWGTGSRNQRLLPWSLCDRELRLFLGKQSQ